MGNITQEGLNKLKSQLHELKTKGRSEMAKQIAEARDKGDLSENAEYDAAKEAQGLMEMKIAKLENTIAQARVLDESQIDTTKVSIMTIIKIRNSKTKKEFTYTLVAEEEADLANGRLSVLSPIGKGLLGKSIGENADIQVPSGIVNFEVLDIKPSW
ncbi:MAG: transcription elongation factor GreA [Cytophagia bacterium]|nr:MAG: transcription elongation factor GreA [Cytophagia bacterium]TAG38502.1 MAG: transcription elongation factor GreA [Cytophagia bacterium]TAH30588.1 MAG: transcription elongation factor GreA [Cytophagales bacterium]